MNQNLEYEYKKGKPYLDQSGKYCYIRRKLKYGNEKRERETLKCLGMLRKESEEAQRELETCKKRYKTFPEGEFDVIYADPPWRYEFPISKSRAIERHYKTMELKEICNLKIPSAGDAILYLWATAPKLEEALEVMKAWGFTYRSNMVWIKPSIGMGYYSRVKHELLLIGIKGKMSPPKTQSRYQSVINAERKEHSKKPDLVYDIIEEAYPPSEYKLLELFARQTREKWTSWGDELCE